MNSVLFCFSQFNLRGSQMTSKERETREMIISFLMKQTGITRQELIANIKELESFGLIAFNSKGDLRFREV